jgi:succinate-acetate transporter protein
LVQVRTQGKKRRKKYHKRKQKEKKKKKKHQGKVSPLGLAALAITTSLSMSGSLAWGVRQLSETVSGM